MRKMLLVGVSGFRDTRFLVRGLGLRALSTEDSSEGPLISFLFVTGMYAI